ncbi:MAG: NifB/NifX family molybdenum-iron cluster-binding protein [Candidatus Sumerlaeota bacterium]
MKIAFTTDGKNLEAKLDRRFGRAAGFLIVDSETKECRFVDNEQNLNAAQGAGIQAAQKVAEAGAEAVVTGHCGPKAFRVLTAAGLEVYASEAATVAEALEQWTSGQIQPIDKADVEGHWV